MRAEKMDIAVRIQYIKGEIVMIQKRYVVLPLIMCMLACIHINALKKIEIINTNYLKILNLNKN